VRSGELECFGGQNVEKVCCRAKGLDPVGRWNSGLKQEGANNIVCGTNNTLGFTVLWEVWGHDIRRWAPWVRKNVRALELSNSRSLSHWTALMEVRN
jgi:hypothetical protein